MKAILQFNIFAFIFFIILIFLQYRLWFEPGGVKDLINIKKNLALQTKQNESLKKRNEAILFQIKRLQNSQEAIESKARSQLGMIKKGETFYQVVSENN